MMFPQQSADLQTRWCSSALKIEPADKVFTNDPRFRRGTFVIIGGERREESANRGLYAAVEKHAATTQARRVERWRPILDWKEGDVWEIIKRHGLRPHPAYEVGFGRCSCMPCIFSNADQWATIKQIAPKIFEKIGALESVFGKTIKAGETVDQQADKGTSYLDADEKGEREVAAIIAMQETYLGEVRVPTASWKLPAGAFVRSGGPT
jgi:3'-phosphoadenosine 5'-phosphosulfate sulfotransferase (PAPS reductase)/FAD synthetase